MSALVETGGSGFALHADAFGARHRRPARAGLRPAAGRRQRPSVATRIVNSASHAKGGALGGSLVWDRGYLGASVDTYRNDYGIVAEDDVDDPDAARQASRWPASCGRPAASSRTLRGQAASTDYQHHEIEGDGTVGTTFKTRGSDARLEAVHRAVDAGWRARRRHGRRAVRNTSRFSALGEEAFVPSTRTRQGALFLLERWTWRDAGTSAPACAPSRCGSRSAGDADPAAAQFGAAARAPVLAAQRLARRRAELAPQWQLIANGSYTERAPTSYELYANGVHAATSAYERGDPAAASERGRNLDLAIGWSRRRPPEGRRLREPLRQLHRAGGHRRAGLVDDAGDTLPVFVFRGVRARLHGVELEGRWRVLQAQPHGRPRRQARPRARQPQRHRRSRCRGWRRCARRSA